MTPEQLRQLADSTEAREYWLDDHVRLAMQFRAHAAALEKLQRAEAELAKLRQHAEAMADELREPMALRDYRADFPKDAK